MVDPLEEAEAGTRAFLGSGPAQERNAAELALDHAGGLNLGARSQHPGGQFAASHRGRAVFGAGAVDFEFRNRLLIGRRPAHDVATAAQWMPEDDVTI